MTGHGLEVGKGIYPTSPHILLYRSGSDPSRKDETTNARTYILGAVLLIVLLVLPAGACPSTCPPGTEYRCVDQCYGNYGSYHLGRCGGRECCQEVRGILGVWWYRTQQQREVCDCVAVTCPAIPCDDGFHCVETQCTPDICGQDFQCDEGFQCGDQNQCVEIPRISSFSPYTEPACQAILTNKRPMDDIDPSTLPLLDLKNTYISSAFHYVSQFDCVYMAYYTRGEPSFNQHCTAVEYYNREQAVIYSHGGMPILTAMNPAGAVCVAAVKNSAAESTLPVTITLTDSHGTTVDSIVSYDPIIVQCYRLPDDFNECRLRDSFLQAMSWVK